MSVLSENATLFDRARTRSKQHPNSGQITLRVVEWKDNGGGETVELQSVKALIGRPPCKLRIICTKPDLFDKHYTSGLLDFFEQYSIPSAFVSERIQSVSHSFGTRRDDDGGECAWLHFLCKHIGITHDQKQPKIAGLNIQGPATAGSDFGWIRSGYFLKIKSPQGPSSPTQSCNTPSDDTDVTLICFGPPRSMFGRFARLKGGTQWRKTLENPLLLLDIVLDELFLQLDESAWSLSNIYGYMEHDILSANREMLQEFATLHNVAKFAVYLNESADALLATINAIMDYNNDRQHNNQSAAATNALRYRKETVHSTRLRLGSLEKRIQNTISLAFNLATQNQGSLMQADSNSMRQIAALTLFFLPATAVATVCSSAFFSFGIDDNGHQSFIVNRYFWIYWLVSLSLTVIVLVAPKAFEAATKAIPQRSEKNGPSPDPEK